MADTIKILSQLSQRSDVQKVQWSCAHNANCNVWIKRDDLFHPQVSGNKLFKLFYYLQQAIEHRAAGLISFGGRYSNHLYALAKVARAINIPCVGVIRGAENTANNATLQDITADGMQLMRVDRATYRQKMNAEFLAQLNLHYPGYYVIPEGGAGLLGAQGFADYAEGVSSQLKENDLAIDSIWLPAGTGTTVAGLSARWPNVQAVCALALDQPQHYITEIAGWSSPLQRSDINNEKPNPIGWHGFNVPFGKLPASIMECCLDFWRETGVVFDPIYGSKVLFALQQAFANGLHNQNILIIHTGGVQGWRGFMAGKRALPCDFSDAVEHYMADQTSFILDDTDLTLGLSAPAKN